MNKNVLAVFAAVSGLVMVSSCDTPKDQRPEAKASVDLVAPGTRSTYNVSDAGSNQPEVSGHDEHSEHKEDGAVLNHDPGANTLEKGEKFPETEKANEADSVENR